MAKFARVLGKALRGASSVAVPAAMSIHQARLDEKAAKVAHEYRMKLEQTRYQNEGALLDRRFQREDEIIANERAYQEEMAANQPPATPDYSDRYITVARDVIQQAGEDEFGNPITEKVRVNDLWDTQTGTWAHRAGGQQGGGSPQVDGAGSAGVPGAMPDDPDYMKPPRAAIQEALDNPNLRDDFIYRFDMTPEEAAQQAGMNGEQRVQGGGMGAEQRPQGGGMKDERVRYKNLLTGPLKGYQQPKSQKTPQGPGDLNLISWLLKKHMADLKTVPDNPPPPVPIGQFISK